MFCQFQLIKVVKETFIIKNCVAWLVLCLNLFWMTTTVQGQNILIPGAGIKNDSIRVNKSSIHQAISTYGNDFEIEYKNYATIYHYPKSGISYRVLPYDKNKIIREIFFTSPFVALTENGIAILGARGSFIDSLFNCEISYYDNYCELVPVPGIKYICISDKKNILKTSNVSSIVIYSTDSLEKYPPANYIYDTLTEIQAAKHLFETMRANPYLPELSKLMKEGIDEFSPNDMRCFSRSLELNIQQSDYDFDIGKTGFNMMVLSRNDTAFYISVSKKDSVVLLYDNEQLTSDFISRHNAFYTSNIDIENEIQFPSKMIVFGYGCGFAGVPPPYLRKMDALVKNLNYNEISIWLRSANPEIQAYGIYGMNELYKLGKQIQKADLEIIRHLFDSSINLYACNGCLYGEPLLFHNVIKHRDFRKLFREYRKYH